MSVKKKKRLSITPNNTKTKNEIEINKIYLWLETLRAKLKISIIRKQQFGGEIMNTRNYRSGK